MLLLGSVTNIIISLKISMCTYDSLMVHRSERALDIDMRIGVHSGSLLAGVIGQTKLQFDIWGRPFPKEM